MNQDKLRKHVMDHFSQINAEAAYRATGSSIPLSLGDIRETAKRVSFMRQMQAKEDKYQASVEDFLKKINQ